MGNVLASDPDLLLRFAEAYAKAFARNTQFIEAVGKFIEVFESLVSRNVLLMNPFDEVDLTGETNQISLQISQTDHLFDDYEDITLPEIKLVSSQPTKVQVYKLFSWG